MKVNNRKFDDIQSLAERIRKNRHVEGDLEAFSQCSISLKKQLLDSTDNPLILDRLEQLPDIAYQEFSPSLMKYLRLNAISDMWNNRYKRKEILRKVGEIAAIYNSIHFLMQREQGLI